MKTPMMVELGELDPARDLRAPGHADDEVLAGILAQSRTDPADQRAPRRPGRAAAVASAAAAAAVAVVVVSTLDAPAAYASWTPVPDAVTPAEAAERSQECGGVATEIVDGPDGPVTEQVPVTPVLTDVRGEYTYVVLAGDGAYGECFVTTGGDRPAQTVESSVVLPERAPAAREVTTLQLGTASWSQDDGTEGALTSAFGQVGDDVTAVELTLTSGERVAATVSDGWWAVWAPGGASLGSVAELVHDDGTTSRVDLT